MKTLFLSAMLLCGGALLMPVRPALAQTMSVVATSDLAGVPLPGQTLRLATDSIPHEVSDALESLVKPSEPDLAQGRNEVLAWSGNGYTKARAKEWKTRLAATLQKAGWQYTEGAKLTKEGATLVTATRNAPTHKALIGFWTPTDDALILAWTEIVPARGGANGNTGIVPPDTPGDTEVPADDAPPATGDDGAALATDGDEGAPASAPVAGRTIDVSEGEYVVNAAKGLPEPHVNFPKLAPIPGKARGYVYGTDGKPLKGAIIGVRSTAVGGAETSASAKTDAKGYYEVLVPFGAAGFYASGYTKEYGDGILGMGLSPADGEANEFASNVGHVENWILKPYGIADRAGVQDQPQYLNNYYGGAVVLEFVNQDSMMAAPGKGIPYGMTVETTLTPKGALMDGSKGQPIIVRKTLSEGGDMRLYINNIPVGTYTISVRGVRGNRSYPMAMRETGPYMRNSFGISPKQANGSAELLFRPYSADPEMAAAGHGNWKQVQLDLTLQ